MDPVQRPAVLVANHGSFTWGVSPAKAVESTVVLEQIAAMAVGTITINPELKEISMELRGKQYLRKYGKDAYYGQKKYNR